MSTFAVSFSNYFTANTGGDVRSGGSLKEFKEITGLTEAFDIQVEVANTSADNFNVATVWQDGDSGVQDFSFMYVENLNTTSGQDLVVGLTRDRAGTPGHANIKVPAATSMIVPNGFLTTADLTDGSAETADLVDQIRFKNDNDATAADISVRGRIVLLR